jgi:hypothetical protein
LVGLMNGRRLSLGNWVLPMFPVNSVTYLAGCSKPSVGSEA